jgi:hypothetical protein
LISGDWKSPFNNFPKKLIFVFGIVAEGVFSMTVVDFMPKIRTAARTRIIAATKEMTVFFLELRIDKLFPINV